MVGWLYGHKSEQTPGSNGGQMSLCAIVHGVTKGQ